MILGGVYGQGNKLDVNKENSRSTIIDKPVFEDRLSSRRLPTLIQTFNYLKLF